MKTKEIRDLVKIVEESNVDELEVSRWGHKIRITKNAQSNANSQQPQQITIPAQQPQQVATPAPATQPQSANGGAPAAEPETEASKEDAPSTNYEEIKSPIVGTFYRSPSPEDPSYVSIGDSVKPGQTLCIIEAMKIMNEIESEVSGVVKEIKVENAEPVEYNQTLFLIEPS